MKTIPVILAIGICATLPAALHAHQPALTQDAASSAETDLSQPLAADDTATPPPVQDDAFSQPLRDTQALSSAEGLQIVAQIRNFRGRGVQLDCSHLAHEVYRAAGFDFAYATSDELYAGVTEFHRIAQPQPGDLIVWPGHVGIVVDVRQRTFFSALSYGAAIDFYDSRDWLERGRARFYRYRLSTRRTPELVRAAAGDEAPGMRRTESHRMTTAALQPVMTEVAISTGTPSVADVAAGLQELSASAAAAIGGGRAFRPPASVCIADQVKVQKLHAKHGRGWADIALHCRATYAPERLATHPHKRHSRWKLERRQDEWWLIAAEGKLMTTRDSSVHSAAQSLARLTEAGADRGSRAQEARLAHLLDVLLAE